ncbi:MAG: hypothetical protein HFI01_07220, partial [Lachnospiraceae bacterium]|nr:hypothetical protein [Lachnospiraceae bacterium]
ESNHIYLPSMDYGESSVTENSLTEKKDAAAENTAATPKPQENAVEAGVMTAQNSPEALADISDSEKDSFAPKPTVLYFLQVAVVCSSILLVLILLAGILLRERRSKKKRRGKK